MKVAIIEDEKLTAEDLKRTLLAIDPSIDVDVMLHSVEEAAAFLAQGPSVDLIFSDIELGDGLSLEAFDRVQNTTPVVFCTAYSQYALKAFQASGIDYILKPYSTSSVADAIEKFKRLQQRFVSSKHDYAALFHTLRQQLRPAPISILIHQGDKIIPVLTDDIALFCIDGDGVVALTFDKRRLALSQSLEQLEHASGPSFFRVNRQHLINRRAVKDAAHFFNRKLLVNLTVPFEEQVLVGKLRVSVFLQWLVAAH